MSVESRYPNTTFGNAPWTVATSATMSNCASVRRSTMPYQPKAKGAPPIMASSMNFDAPRWAWKKTLMVVASGKRSKIVGAV